MKRSQDDWDADLSAAQLTVLRAHAARLAEVFAERWADALAGEDYFSATYWSERYARASARCAALGEFVRRSIGRDSPVAHSGHVLGNRG